MEKSLAVDKTVEYNCDGPGGDGSWGAGGAVHIGRTIWGHFEAPSFLRVPGPGVRTFYSFGGGDSAAGSGAEPLGQPPAGQHGSGLPVQVARPPGDAQQL